MTLAELTTSDLRAELRYARRRADDARAELGAYSPRRRELELRVRELELELRRRERHAAQ